MAVASTIHGCNVECKCQWIKCTCTYLCKNAAALGKVCVTVDIVRSGISTIKTTLILCCRNIILIYVHEYCTERKDGRERNGELGGERELCVGGGGEERKWFRKRVSVCARMCCSLIMSLSKLVAIMEIAAGHVTLSVLFH